MPKVIKTRENPFGLSVKQHLVIIDLVRTIKEGSPINLTAAHMKYYDVHKRTTASVMANENINRPNFREALSSMLVDVGVLSVSGKIVQCLSGGLNAYHISDSSEPIPDYRTRLDYIKEINKICRVY